MRSVYGLALFAALVAGWQILPDSDVRAGQDQPKKGDTFDTVVAPFVAKHCIDCHGPQKKKANLALHIYKDEKALLKDRKVWTSVLQMLTSGEMPPVGRPQPTIEEVEALQKAVYGIFDVADAGKRDPGKVTMRRLNRAEYKNTIRDLVGVDFDPTEDFPADDVGYGFDNIGDVLSISPVLMERYLVAAEEITRRAIHVGDPPPPAKRPTAGQFLQSKESKIIRDTSLRILDVAGDFSATHKILDEGKYTFRIRAYSKQVGDEPVKVAFKVDGEQIHTAEIKPGSGKTDAKIYEAPPLDLKPGEHTISLTFLNPYTDPDAKKTEDAKRTLYVRNFEFEGPPDTMPPIHKRLMLCDRSLPKRKQAREILTRFASRAYRRPATKDEIERLLQFVDRAEKNNERFEAGIQLAMQAVLCSPKFLFRVELDDRPTLGEPHPITDYQLASRLSFFLWNTMPDDELFSLARKNQLHENVETQVRRMLKDPRASALTESFLTQWLQLGLLKNASPDRKLFPDFDDPLRAAMARETQLAFDAIHREDRSVLELIDAPYTFLNERLARHYGITDTAGNTSFLGRKIRGETIPRDKFVKVSLQGDQRGGILTQASVLTITSNPTRTSPVKRGKWVLEQILGTPPPPPPPNVPELEDKGRQLTGSLRQRMEQHRENPSCANCHARMDAMGFAFENFDAIGRFRKKDGNFEIDPSGTLPSGQSFKGPGELKQVLLSKKDLFARTLTEKLLTYALGRGLEYYDRKAVDGIVAAVRQGDYRFSTMVVEITKSDPFRMRRGKDNAQ
jgi:mono/diheme cytochrome c family protein